MSLIKKLLPIFLIFILFVILIFESLADTPTYDEPANMAASFDYVYRNDYRLYPDNPPLVKIIAGIFLYPIAKSIKFPDQLPEYNNPDKFNHYTIGTNFLYKTGNDTEKIIFLARLPNILFTVGIGFLLYLFAKNLFGQKAGLLALFLYSFDPNIRGHGHILAFDLPVAFFILLSLYLMYLFYREITSYPNPEFVKRNDSRLKKRSFYLQNKPFIYGFLLSLVFALGFLTKFTFIFFAVAFFAGMYFLLAINLSKKRKKSVIKSILLLQLSIILVSLFFLWIFGLATGYNNRSFNYDEVPIIASANKTLSNNFVWNLFGNLPVPYYYKTGMRVMYTHNIISQPAYLLGEVRAKNDWFFYFPVSFMLKTPIPTLLLIFIALFLLAKKTIKGKRIFPNYVFFLLGGFYFLCLMLFSHINNVYRYLFPSLILFIMGSSQIATTLPKTGSRTGNARRILIFLLVFYLFLTSLFSFPYDLSYTNELTGIPPAGYKYLSDSEIDWGQDLGRLAKWLRENNLINETITLSYLGTADPEFYGIKYKPLRFEELDKLQGMVVISVGNLTLGDWMVRGSDYYKLGFIKTAPLDILRNRKPEAVIGKSIFVYRFLD